ncbi:MAG TPA: hypothetical protein PLP14_08145, partial [Chitinophagaceae bacterium]|nr:hypothetical protein [Chitinophagaceae bacterium]
MKHRYNLNSSTNAYVSREKRGRFTHSLYSLLVLVLLLSGINLNAQTISLMVDQPIACNGNTDGSIQASTDLTGPNVAYSLNGGAYSNTSGFFNNLAPGTYTVCVSDDPSSISSIVVCDTISLIEPPAINISFVVDSLPGCTGGNLGGISAIITGGTILTWPGYYTYWYNSASTLLNPIPQNYDTWIQNLTPDVYTLTVEDEASCMATQSISLPELCLFIDQNVSCYGANDGTVQASTSAAGTWTYSRDGGLDPNTSGLFINLSVGQHTICMTDGSNTYCSTVTITQPDPLVVSISPDLLVSCYGNDGAITATVTGGTAILQPYQTTWQSGVTTSSIYDLSVSGLSVGTYTVTVEDDHACISTATYTLGANPPVSVTASAPVILCSGGTTTVTAVPTGGSGVFPSVTISGGSWVVGVGTYTITATDDRNCSATTVITTTQLPALGATLNIDVLPGCSGSTGTVSAVISGGTGPYTTAWTNSSMVLLNPSPNDHATSMSGLLSDTYQLTVTDANGCTYNTSIFVPDLCLFVDQNVSCHGADDGTVQASTSAAGSWTYYRDGGFDYNTSGLFINLTVGQHTICMTDGLNTYCSTVTITQPDPLVVTISADLLVSCYGNDGAITATVTGGTAILQPYQTTWQSG